MASRPSGRVLSVLFSWWLAAFLSYHFLPLLLAQHATSNLNRRASQLLDKRSRVEFDSMILFVGVCESDRPVVTLIGVENTIDTEDVQILT